MWIILLDHVYLVKKWGNRGWSRKKSCGWCENVFNVGNFNIFLLVFPKSVFFFNIIFYYWCTLDPRLVYHLQYKNTCIKKSECFKKEWIYSFPNHSILMNVYNLTSSGSIFLFNIIPVIQMIATERNNFLLKKGFVNINHREYLLTSIKLFTICFCFFSEWEIEISSFNFCSFIFVYIV